MQEFESLGKHLIRRDGDSLHWRLRGTVDRDEVLALHAHALPIVAEHGYMLVLIDARQGGQMDADARRETAELHKRHPTMRRKTIVYGANPMTRALTVLVMRALALFTRKPPDVTMVASEADALALRDRVRAQLLSAPPGPPGPQDPQDPPLAPPV